MEDKDSSLQSTSLTCFFYLYAVIFDEPVPMQIKVSLSL